ncbi:MAG: sugar ABC transporter ATP-binding protein [Mycoplasmatales bacterium]
MKVQIKNVEKSFGSNQVLFDASINIEAGEVHAFMGENGAGKSTLMNILKGDLTFDKGVIKIDDKEVIPYNNPDKRISFIRQELNLVKDLKIYENIFLGKMNDSFIVDDNKLINKANEIFNMLGLEIDPKRYVSSLSVGEQQMVEIAKGLVDDCELLIMDEPTAALTDKEIVKLFDIINNLKSKGVAIVYISHRMKEIFMISDKITVMRDGCFIKEYVNKDITEDMLISSMVGRDVDIVDKDINKKFGEVVLSVKNITSTQQGFKDINFEIREGEIVALAGLMGSKRTEILEAIFSVNKIDSGEILYFGEDIANSSIKNVINKGIALVTEDRKQTGLFLNFNVKTNIGIPNPVHVSENGVLNKNKEKKLSSYFVEKLNIKIDSLNQKVGSLSGGNQQKVVISKWLASMPKLLILDEPTRGIDINAKREIYKLIKEQAKNNIAVLMVSSEMSETLLLADNIIALNEGKQMNKVENVNITEEKLLDLMIGANNEN